MAKASVIAKAIAVASTLTRVALIRLGISYYRYDFNTLQAISAYQALG